MSKVSCGSIVFFESFRADKTRAKSNEVLECLTKIKVERMRLTLYTPSANFTSADVLQYLDGISNNYRMADDDEVSLIQRMSFKHPLRKNVEAFTTAESELGKKVEEKSEMDRLLRARQQALQEAEKNHIAAVKVRCNDTLLPPFIRESNETSFSPPLRPRKGPEKCWRTPRSASLCPSKQSLRPNH